MRIKGFVSICFFFLLLSCSNKSNNKQEEIKVHEPKAEEREGLKGNEEKPVTTKSTSLKLTVEQVDIQSIKTNFLNSNTSAKLSGKESENYLPRTEAVFFGKYFFTDEKSRLPFVATIIVAISKEGKWDYSNNFENVVEFTTFSNQINPFNEVVQIGQSKKNLIEILGNEYESKESNLIYQDSIGDVACILFQNDTIQALKVGKYKTAQDVKPIIPKW